MERPYYYEKLDENNNLVTAPANDIDGKITGKVIIGLAAYFDDYPEERIRLGYIKHYETDKRNVQYDPQTQYTLCVPHWIDNYTIEDRYEVLDKSEDRLVLEELMNEGGNMGGIIISPH